MAHDILQQIFEQKIVAIIRGIGTERILDTVAALVAGGITLLEVTFNQESAAHELETLNSLTLIKEEYGDRVCLGAGTVLSAAQVEKAVAAGAEFIISPHSEREVIEKTKELGKISIPGAFTPSEMIAAYKTGADLVKLFPAGMLGTGYIKALLAPLSHIPVMAVGGVNLENVTQFIKAGAKSVGVGGNLVDRKLIDAGAYDQVRQIAQSYVEKLREG